MRWFLLLLISPLWAQESSCPVRLTVTDTVSKQPVAQADAQFQLRSAQTAYAGRTNAAGQLAASLPPGDYQLSVTRAGFVRSAGGDRLVHCGSGQAIRLDVTLTAAAVLAGRVVDDDGVPMAQLMISLLRQRWAEGGRSWQQVNATNTDTDGLFRINMLEAGKYKLMVQPAQRYQGLKILPLDPSQPPPSYVATYYPGVTDLDQAQVIDLRAGQELRNIDIRLRRGVTYTVRGRVQDMSGTGSAPGQNVAVSLVDRGQGSGPGMVVGMRMFTSGGRADGRFEIFNVAPGSYYLMAFKSTGKEMVESYTPIEVTGDLDGVEAVLRAPFKVSGEVKVEGTEAPEFGKARVMFQPLLTRFGGGRNATPTDGKFVVEALSAGRYRVHLNAPSSQSYLAAIRWNGREYSPAAELEFHAEATGLELIMKTDAAQVSGSVTGEPAPVTALLLLVPVEPQNRSAVTMRMLNCQARQCSARPVPPGEYLAFAVSNFEYVSIWQDADWMKQNEEKMKKVRIRPSESLSIEAPLLQEIQ